MTLQTRSKIARMPVTIPQGVEVVLSGQDIEIKGSKGTLKRSFHRSVEVNHGDHEDSKTGEKSKVLTFKPRDKSHDANAQAGTSRALANNMVLGVSEGFEKTLLLIGVGYRVAVQGNKVNVTAGFSHPCIYELPEGVTAEATKATELVIKGIDLQKVGQVAANIRAIRPPMSYGKGKGIRYKGERLILKETKKK